MQKSYIAELGGRCAVASREMQPGEIILRERPLARWSTVEAYNESAERHFGASANVWFAFVALNDEDRLKVLDLASVRSVRHDQFVEMVRRLRCRACIIHLCCRPEWRKSLQSLMC
jgi:hypothetical protein